MEKNTVIAIVLAGVILFAGTFITQRLNEKNAPPVTETLDDQGAEDVKPFSGNVDDTSDDSASVGSTADEDAFDSDNVIVGFPEQDYSVRTIVEETDLYRIEFSTAGGIVTEILLKNELDDDEPISMVLDGESGVGTFNIAFGDREASYLTDAFDFEKTTRGKEKIFRFSRNYLKDGQVFNLSKIYRIIPGEYMIELRVILETPDGKAVPLLDGNESAYTLTYGPQIGPVFDKIDGRYEIRDNVSWGPDPKSGKWKRQTHRSGRNRETVVETTNTVNWAGIVGKYFAVVVSPGSGSAKISWDGRPADGQEQASRLQISRAARRESVIEDVYRFYIGPLDRANLSRYNSSEENAFGVSGLGLQNVPKTSSWLGWLESILRWLLEQFYKLIPNFGVAIILLTVLVKVILFPFTHKSYESTGKMQAVQPKIKALQEQYKDDPQKLNAKTAELYKAEGVNPMGGCLPMLFQFPIFIALYGLLNRYFPLRGAVFISGWITDLSAPEHIVQFENGVNFFGNTYDAIRLLPILYLGGQLLMTKVTQQGSAGGQTGMQQKMMTLGMPIMFFFILYNMPSGLLLYWTTMNLITIAQQLITNYIKKRNAAGGAA